MEVRFKQCSLSNFAIFRLRVGSPPRAPATVTVAGARREAREQLQLQAVPPGTPLPHGASRRGTPTVGLLLLSRSGEGFDNH